MYLEINYYIQDFINNIFGRDDAFSFFKMIADIGATKSMTIFFIILVVILYFNNNKYQAKYIVILVTINTLIVWLLKIIIDKPRPIGGLLESHSASFPSGHTAGAIILLIVIIFLTKEIKNIYKKYSYIGLAILWLLIMILDRLYLLAHDIYDVSASILIGILCYILVNNYKRQISNFELKYIDRIFDRIKSLR